MALHVVLYESCKNHLGQIANQFQTAEVRCYIFRGWIPEVTEVHLGCITSPLLRNGGFPKIGVPFWGGGVPKIRTIVFWGLSWWSPILGNHQIRQARTFLRVVPGAQKTTRRKTIDDAQKPHRTIRRQTKNDPNLR